MAKQMIRLSAAILLGCFLLPGCAYFSKSGRQQMAYQRYVKKCQKRRDRQRMKISRAQQKIPKIPEEKWELSAGTIESPEAAGPSNSQTEQQ